MQNCLPVTSIPTHNRARNMCIFHGIYRIPLIWLAGRGSETFQKHTRQEQAFFGIFESYSAYTTFIRSCLTNSRYYSCFAAASNWTHIGSLPMLFPERVNVLWFRRSFNWFFFFVRGQIDSTLLNVMVSCHLQSRYYLNQWPLHKTTSNGNIFNIPT